MAIARHNAIGDHGTGNDNRHIGETVCHLDTILFAMAGAKLAQLLVQQRDPKIADRLFGETRRVGNGMPEGTVELSNAIEHCVSLVLK
jgi:hypothetical protein